jgi:hypothetical protein
MKMVQRWFAGSLFLGLALIVGLLAGNLSADSGQSNGWLPFQEGAEPAPPTLALVAADATEIQLEATVPGVLSEKVEADGQAFTRLYGDGFGHPAKVGLPDLPVLRRDVEIPFGADVEIELISAEYSEMTLEELGISPIYPLQPPLPKSEDEGPPLVIDTGFYAQDAFYPAGPLALGEPYIVRGHRAQPVEVWPVAYNPAAGTVRLYQRVVLRLSLRGSDMTTTQAMAERYASPAFEERLAGQLLNFNQGRPAAEFGPNAAVGYLIITSDAYCDAMVPLADLRSSRGFDVTMVRQSEIPNGGTNTGIKAYIQEAYDTWVIPPSYVVLVGDTDTMPGWDGDAIATITDLYYATMDGPDDWHPDIGRGRFPVRSAAQATIMVDKYLAYANLTGQEPWLKTAAFIATCDQYLVAEGTHNYVINSYTGPGGYTGTFPNDPQIGGDQLYCITHSATAVDIQAALNLGRWVAIYSGHGSWSGWEMGYGQDQVRNLTNYGMFPFVASHACVTGDFEQPEVYGETWVLQEDRGALVFWGSSDSSYWDEDDVLERAMFDSLFAEGDDHPAVAEMTDYGLAQTEAAYPYSARYYWETYNILGDPAVKAFLEPDLPTFTLNVEPDSFEVCTSGTVTSSVEIGSVMGYSETVTLNTGPLPGGITAVFDPVSAQAPYTSELSLTVAPGTPSDDYPIVITATDQISWTLDADVNLRVVNDAPAAPALISPPDGATDQPFAPTFEWQAVPFASSYNLQVDPSPLFGAPVIDARDLPGTSYTASSPLEGGRCYWWHVQGEDACGTGEWADPFHFATVNLATAFYDDIESGADQWTHAAAQGVDHWAISTAESHSPTHSWFVPDDAVVTDSRLWNTTPVAVGSSSTLSFWHRYQFEGTSYDGGVLEISINGGDTWTDLGPYITAGGYNGTISTCCSNPLGGREGWTGDLTAWTQVTVDLSAFAGQNANIRWRLGCDSSISDVGWYIDDVEVTAPLPPNPAPTLLSIMPDSGSAYENTPVTVEGSGFITTPVLSLGETWLLSVTRVSSTTLTAVVPAGMAGGVYTLTLYNGDCQEATLADAYTVIVECISPTVSLEAGSPVELGEPMAFTATVTGTPPITYTWQFGDGQVAIGPGLAVITHTYEMAGVYTVTLGVENPCGSDEISQQVVVEAAWRYIFVPVIQK